MRAHPADAATRRTTREGEVIGFSHSDDTWAWCGLPYAAAPVGPLRWRAPRPHAPWEGVRPALRFGQMSLQLKSFMTQSPPSQWNKPIGSEDCLTLNIFASKAPVTQPRPVMVWIHGGGNTGGASSMYPMAANLAAPYDVVVVSVNYRLGIFGWCNHPALFDETCSPEDRSGNYGTLDLIRALTWVRENIAAFGGDPGNVTIFGESAGGQNVLSLYLSPLARGLFHRAIAQSPVTLTVTPESGWHVPGEDEHGHRGSITDLMIKLMSAEGRATSHAEAVKRVRAMTPEQTRDYLVHKDADQLMEMYNGKTVGIYESPRLFRDGHVLPAMSMLDAFSHPDYQSDVPLIIGTNRDEMKLFMLMSPEYTKPVFGQIPLIKNLWRYQIDADYFSRMWKAIGVDEPLAGLYRAGRRNLWCYRFDWDEIPALPVIRPDILIGATHVMEIPFVMNDLRGQFNPFRTFTKRNRASRVATTRAMSALWTTFARTGNPNGPGLPAWDGWSPRGTRNTLVIDAESSGGIRMEATDATIGSVKQQLRDDTRFTKHERERYRLFAQLFMGDGLFGRHADDAEYQQAGRLPRPPAPATSFTRKPVL